MRSGDAVYQMCCRLAHLTGANTNNDDNGPERLLQFRYFRVVA